MTDKTKCEIFLAINENGDWYVAADEDDAGNGLAENDGGAHIRIVKITAHVQRPALTEATVDVPDEAGSTIEVEAA